MLGFRWLVGVPALCLPGPLAMWQGACWPACPRDSCHSCGSMRHLGQSTGQQLCAWPQQAGEVCPCRQCHRAISGGPAEPGVTARQRHSTERAGPAASRGGAGPRCQAARRPTRPARTWCLSACWPGSGDHSAVQHLCWPAPECKRHAVRLQVLVGACPSRILCGRMPWRGRLSGSHWLGQAVAGHVAGEPLPGGVCCCASVCLSPCAQSVKCTPDGKAGVQSLILRAWLAWLACSALPSPLAGCRHRTPALALAQQLGALLWRPQPGVSHLACCQVLVDLQAADAERTPRPARVHPARARASPERCWCAARGPAPGPWRQCRLPAGPWCAAGSGPGAGRWQP